MVKIFGVKVQLLCFIYKLQTLPTLSNNHKYIGDYF